MDIQYECWINSTKTIAVHYPYITSYQEYVFRTENKLLLPEQAKDYVLSLPAFLDERASRHLLRTDGFDFFCREFDVDWAAKYAESRKIGPGPTPAHLVILIASGKALSVHLQYNDELLVDNIGGGIGHLNYQRRLMERLLEFESPYYRLWYHNNNVCLLFGEPFTAEVLENLFMWCSGEDLAPLDVLRAYFERYLCYQAPEVITGTIDILCKNSARIDKTQWLLAIVTEIKRRLRHPNWFSQQQRTGLQTIIDYCLPTVKELISQTDSLPMESSLINHECAYFNIGSSLEELNREFDVLVSEGYLPVDTNRNDFLYYFGGKEEAEKAGKPLTVPKKKLTWIGKKKKIFGLFLDSLGVDETWKTASAVFDSINEKSFMSAISTYKKKKKEMRSEDTDMIRSTEDELSRIVF